MSADPTDDFFAPTPRRFNTKHLIIATIAVAVGGFWIIQAFRRGSFLADPSGVTNITYTRPADGERDVLPNAFIAAYLNPGHAIDPDSLGPQTVQLYRTADRKLIPAQINTSGGNDDIVLTPMSLLEPGTRYTFA